MNEPERRRLEASIDAPEDDVGQRLDTVVNPPATVAASGRRQAFRDIRRELQEADLTPGVMKMVVDELDRSEAECEVLKSYVDRYHTANTKAAILEEKLKTNTAMEIFFAVGLGVGCAIIGLAPTFWDKSEKGPITLTVGALLVFGSIVGRLVKLL